MAQPPIDLFLRKILSACEPTQTQKATAARSENFLRDLLHDSKLPILDSYLSGSYARDTALRPIDDVDILFLIDPDYWQKNKFVVFGKPNPKEILETFARAIRYRYEESSVRLQKCSVNLSLHKLEIDVVPAIIADSNTTAVYVGNQFNGDWSVSNPKEHTRKAAEINKITGGLFKPLVKLVKCWNSGLPSTARVKSFLLETIAMHLFATYPLPSLSAGLIHYWDHLLYAAGESHLYNWCSVNVSLSWWNHSVPDIGRTGNNIAATVEHEVITKLVNQARISRDTAMAAAKARTIEGEMSHWERALKL